MNFHKVFNGAKFVTAAVAVSMMFTACGDKKSPSSPERDDNNSSAVEESSSSKGGDSQAAESSSSGAPESSSSEQKVETPEGTRIATIDDLAKNLSLGEMFGTEVYLATGNHKGLFSLWIPDTAWVVFDSKFENGVLSFDSSSAAYSGLVGPAVVDSMFKLGHVGAKISFVVDTKDSTLKFSTDGKNYKTAEPAKVQISDAKMSNSDNLKGIKLSCKNGDVTEDYTFFNGRYYSEFKSGDSVTSWSSGYYDIQRSYLFMLPKFFNGAVSNLFSYFVNPENMALSFYGDVKKECEKKTVEYEEISAKDIAGNWIAGDKTVEWSFDIYSNGVFKISAEESGSTVQTKGGLWEVYGNMMFLRAKSCLHPSSCTQYVKGEISGFDAKSGFEFSHNDQDTPAMPKTWTLPQYE